MEISVDTIAVIFGILMIAGWMTFCIQMLHSIKKFEEFEQELPQKLEEVFDALIEAQKQSYERLLLVIKIESENPWFLLEKERIQKLFSIFKKGVRHQ